MLGFYFKMYLLFSSPLRQAIKSNLFKANNCIKYRDKVKIKGTYSLNDWTFTVSNKELYLEWSEKNVFGQIHHKLYSFHT